LTSLSSPVSRIDHACLMADSFAEKKAAMLPYIKRGLELGDECLLITDDRREDDWCFELQAYGIDVDAERKADRLVIRQSHLITQGCGFNSVGMARTAWTGLQASLSAHSSLRMAVDVTAAYVPHWSPDQVCHWEATLDLLYEGLPVQVLCTYDRPACSYDEIEAALRTHSSVLSRKVIWPNRSYDARAVLAEEQFTTQHAAWPLRSRGVAWRGVDKSVE